MRRLPRIALLVALVAIMPVLAGCANFDPDSMDIFGLNSKEKLKGKRELLFPNGVPGVTQGIPPQYEKGYQAPAIADLPPGDQDATPQTAKSAPVESVRQSNLGKPMAVHKPAAKRTVKRTVKRKPRRHVVKRKPKPKATETASKPKGTAAPWPSTPAQQAATQQKGTQAPWPSATPQQRTQAGWPGGQQQQQQQDQKLAPWPSAPPSGTFSK